MNHVQIKRSYRKIKRSKSSKNMPAFRVQTAHSVFLQSFWLFFFFCKLNDPLSVLGLLRPFEHEVCSQNTRLIRENGNMQVEGDRLIFLSEHVLLKWSAWIQSRATEQDQTKPSVESGKLNVPEGWREAPGISHQEEDSRSRQGVNMKFCF